MKRIELTRTSKGHAMNHRSSRSHCILTLTCRRQVEYTITRSKFLFVDLAGSERIFKSNTEKTKAFEARNINQSLTTLGRCIYALRERN